MEKQRPSIGRIVHYVHKDATQDEIHAAGLILAVNKDESIIVSVHLPDGRIFPTAAIQDEKKKSLNTWHWPERE